MKRLMLLGSGGHSKVLVSILHSQNKKIDGYFDIEDKGNFLDIPYLGIDNDLLTYDASKYHIVNGLGDLTTRNKLYNYFKTKNYNFINVIHTNAIVAQEVEIGEGVQIFANAIIQPSAIIGDNSIINSGVIVEHDCKIKNGVHLSPGTVLSGGVEIFENSHLGSNCTVLPNISIGKNVVVGAGSVITKNIENNTVCWGNPATERSKNE